MNVWRTGSRAEKVQSVKLRWRLAYKIAGKLTNEMGEVPEFTIA